MKMNCRTACAMADPFIQNRLPVWEMEDFLTHIQECSDCKEELEMTYTLDLVLQRPEEEDANFDSVDALEDLLLSAEQKVFYLKIYERITLILETIAIWCIILVTCLQVYEWFQSGFINIK